MPDLPAKWELAACDAGDFTLRERESGQLMHSRIGPWTEANAVYVAQSELNGQDSQKDSVVLYDVGMGIAANALAAIAAHKSGTLKIYSFEKQPDALALALASPAGFPFHDPYREILQELLHAREWRSASVEWHLITGDFRDADLVNLPNSGAPADLVYFDFYAPQTCPELWTPEVFLKLRGRMAEKGRLITYSTAKSIRAAMLLADFFVAEGTPTQMKAATTVASPCRGGVDKLLGAEWLSGLTRATRPLPKGWEDLRKHPQFSLCF